MIYFILENLGVVFFEKIKGRKIVEEIIMDVKECSNFLNKLMGLFVIVSVLEEKYYVLLRRGMSIVISVICILKILNKKLKSCRSVMMILKIKVFFYGRSK